jgi:glycosyltransferase 2 family protein
MTATIRAILLGLGLVLLARFVVRLDVPGTVSAIHAARADLLTLAVLLLAANVGTKAFRWQMMTRHMHDRPLPFASAMAAILAGVSAASLTPGRGVELAKPLLLRSSHGVPMATSTAGVVVERLLDGAALGVLFVLSLVVVPAARLSAFRPVLAGIALFMAIGLALLMLPHKLAGIVAWATTRLRLPTRVQVRVASVTSRFADALAGWRGHRALWVLLALSVLAAFLEVLRLAAVCTSLGLPVGVAEAMLAFSAANLLAAVSFVPGGIGITEVSLAGLLVLATGVPPQTAVGVSVLVDRTLSYYLVVALGAVVLITAAQRTSGDGNAAVGR